MIEKGTSSEVVVMIEAEGFTEGVRSLSKEAVTLTGMNDQNDLPTAATIHTHHATETANHTVVPTKGPTKDERINLISINPPF